MEVTIPRVVPPHRIRGLDKRDNEESRVTPLLSNYVTTQSPPLLTLYNQKYKNALARKRAGDWRELGGWDEARRFLSVDAIGRDDAAGGGIVAGGGADSADSALGGQRVGRGRRW